MSAPVNVPEALLAGKDYVGKLVAARNSTGDLVAVGRCVSYCDVPTVDIVTPKGTRMSWRVDRISAISSDPSVVDELVPR